MRENSANGLTADRSGQSAARIDTACHCIRGFCMPTLLHIDSSPLYNRSVSYELAATFVTQWKAYPISLRRQKSVGFSSFHATPRFRNPFLAASIMRRVISSVRTSFRSAMGSDAVSASVGFTIVVTEDFGSSLILLSSLAKVSGRRWSEPQTIET